MTIHTVTSNQPANSLLASDTSQGILKGKNLATGHALAKIQAVRDKKGLGFGKSVVAVPRFPEEAFPDKFSLFYALFTRRRSWSPRFFSSVRALHLVGAAHFNWLHFQPARSTERPTLCESRRLQRMFGV